MFRCLLFSVLVSAAASQQVYSEYAKPQVDIARFSDITSDQFFNRFRDFFSLENVGATTLGRIMAWKGDLIQPVALFSLGVFALYTLFRYW